MILEFLPQWCRNEKEVESKLVVQFLLPKLGYGIENWYQEVNYKKVRFDFLLMPIAPNEFEPKIKLSWCIIIEAKNPQENLNNHLRKFKSYLNILKVHYGLITNGKEIRIYQRNLDTLNLVFKCQGKDINQKIAQINQLIGKESILTKLNLLANQNQSQLLPDINLKKSVTNSLNINQENDRKSMKIIAVYHNKGGVGKTTTVINLAAALAKKGSRILIIDLDSQANTTFAVGLAKFTDETEDDLQDSNVYHIIASSKKYSIQEVARKCTYVDEEIYAIPAHISIMEKERDLLDVAASRMRIRNKLEDVKNDYDYVLIDTPPSLNLYAKIGIITSDYLMIPSDLKPFANEGLKNVQKFIQEINDDKETFGMKPIKILGVLPSKVSTNHSFNKYSFPKRREVIKERYNLPLFETNIYEREDLAKAVEHSLFVGNLEIPDPKSIFAYKPDSISAGEFEALAFELEEKIEVSI